MPAFRPRRRNGFPPRLTTQWDPAASVCEATAQAPIDGS